MKKRVLIATAILTAALVATGCGSKKQTATTDEQTDSKVLVKTDEARVETVAQTIDFTTTLEPNLQNFICPTLTATITKIYVNVGDYVRKGQMLVEMDKTQYNTYALQLSNLELTLSRYKAVYEQGGVSRKDIDDLENNIAVLRETVDNLKRNTEFRSPMDGVITGRYNDPGDLFTMSPNADGGVGILRVMQVNPLKATVGIPDRFFQVVKTGMPVSVAAEALPGESFTGKVTRVNPAVNSATRTFSVEIAIPNANETLRAGMFARATFDMGLAESVTVEDVAIQRQQGTNERFVFVINNGTAEKRTVTAGRQVGNRVEVLSGLAAGENVAVAGMSRLDTGTKVRESQEPVIEATTTAQ